MELDRKTYRAKVTLVIDEDVKVPEDSEAIITSASLLGDSYIAIGAGGSDVMLEPGEEFAVTQGSINITDLIVKFGGGAEK
jgi:phospholipid/cholesterol/gamma-HCH transport system substrate-binding protein